MILNPSGFWSYVRDDDDSSDGHIRRLSKRLASEFRLQTGSEINIFLDRDHIEWGEAWQEKIDVSIHGTTFFIPIITPSYLTSAACRDEFLKFWTKSKQSEFKDLILPILYVQIPLDTDSDDEVVRIVSGLQYEDWTANRLEEENSSAHRQAVNRLAIRLREIAESVSHQPENTSAFSTGEVTEGVVEPQGEFNHELGWLDRLSTVDDEMERWTEAADKYKQAMEDTVEIVQSLENYKPADNRASTRIVALKRFAKTLSEPTQRLVDSADNFKHAAIAIGDCIEAATQMAKETTPEDREKALELADTIQGVIDGVESELVLDSEFERSMKIAGQMSRDMRQPTKQIGSSLRTILDTATLMQQWVKTLRSVDE